MWNMHSAANLKVAGSSPAFGSIPIAWKISRSSKLFGFSDSATVPIRFHFCSLLAFSCTGGTDDEVMSRTENVQIPKPGNEKSLLIGTSMKA